MKKKIVLISLAFLISSISCDKKDDNIEKDHQEIIFLNSNPEIMGVGYNSGYDAGNIGTDLDGIVFQIAIDNSTSSSKQVNFHYGNASAYVRRYFDLMISPEESYTQNIFVRVDPDEATETDKLFISSDNDISGLTIKAKGVYLLKHIDEQYQETKFLNSSRFSITASGYNSGYNPGNIGTDIHGIVFQMLIDNNSENSKQVNFHFGNSTDQNRRYFNLMMAPGEKFSENVFFNIDEANENDRLFVTSGIDLTGLSITVSTVYYVAIINEEYQQTNFLNSSNPFVIASPGYNSGYDPGNIGTDINGLGFQITLTNTTDSDKQVNFHYGGASAQNRRYFSMMVSAGEDFSENVFFRVNPDEADENDRLFVASDDNISGLNISVKSAYFIK